MCGEVYTALTAIFPTRTPDLQTALRPVRPCVANLDQFALQTRTFPV